MPDDPEVVILAGGRSSRMGRPKAWLDFGGVSLLQRIINRLEPTFSHFLVVAAPGQELPPIAPSGHPARVVHDERPGEGPLGGLVVGLRELPACRSVALVLTCDVPFVSRTVAEYLVEASDGYDVVVPEWQGRLNPLQAAYRRTCQPLVAELFAAGRRRPVDLFDRVRTRTVREEEIRALDPEGLTFLNMNSPEEYERALEIAARLEGNH
jgi:molybdopterin-guanine dinucleotide biosynthesis protein A